MTCTVEKPGKPSFHTDSLAPPLHDARNCFFVSRPAQLVGKSCAGRETSRGWEPAISAGLKPRPSDRWEKGILW